MKIELGALLLAVGLGLTPTVAGAAEERVSARPVAVVELFTSQGCASCPPADVFLSELSGDRELVTISYAVDLWDYMGWKDTAAKPEFTKRQKGYAGGRGDHDVFTPQVVINGRRHMVGSDRSGIRRELAARSGEARDLKVDVDLEITADSVVVRVGAAPKGVEATTATVWLVRYDLRRTVPIGRGENTGRTLTYTHLARSLQPIGLWKGQPATIEVPRGGEPVGERGVGCAVLVQGERDGQPAGILGARTCSLPAS